VDLGELLSRTLADMRIGGGIAVERRPDGDLPPVMADAGQLGVVFRNIIQNAVEAMPGGGKLEVGAAVNGSNVEVTVRDTGRGMSGAEMGRLFDPFFTTKPRGIGLGLPVARQLVEGHGGTIRVDSRPGSGSTFTVILPVGKGAGQ
jgi:signal transduction histidine kinase